MNGSCLNPIGQRK